MGRLPRALDDISHPVNEEVSMLAIIVAEDFEDMFVNGVQTGLEPVIHDNIRELLAHVAAPEVEVVWLHVLRVELHAEVSLHGLVGAPGLRGEG